MTANDRAGLGPPAPPMHWGKDQVVAHRITGRVGVVQRADNASEDWTGVARMENLWEVGPHA